MGKYDIIHENIIYCALRACVRAADREDENMVGEYLDNIVEETENVAIENTWKLLTASKERTFVAVQISPAVRVSITEKLGMHRGEDGIGKLVAALTALGADAVVDTAIAADALTLARAQAVSENKRKGGAMPVFSSECSVWTAYAKEKYPEIAAEMLPTATTVCAKMLKRYYGKIYPDRKIRVIALEMGEGKKADLGVDVVLTVDELAELLWETGVNIRLLKKMPLSIPFGGASGGGYIGAASGGDAEAVVRCLLTDKTQNALRKLEYSGLYGVGNRREATIVDNGTEWKVAVVDSLVAADALIADIQAGAAYDYVEVAACAGGCVGVNCPDEMTRRLRKLGLKYLDFARSARSADCNSSAAALLKQWNALCRTGMADQYDEIEEIVFDFDDVVEEIAEEVAQFVAEEVAHTVAEEVVEEPAEEIIEEVVEEVVEEPVEEVVEEVVEEPVEEVVEEVTEEVVEEPVEKVVEEVTEEVVEEPVEEVVEEVVEEPVEEVVEEVVEEPVEEVVEAVTDEVVEEPVEEVVEEVTEEIVEEPVEEVVEEVTEEIVEEPVEEVVEEIVEEPVEEVIEEVVEEPVEEVVEEVTEEIVEEPVEEVVEEVTEEIVEEPVEEV
ncbi:MAG: hypothetical protein E7377_02115, partial [Clostridiales bacterium]|nr:hypothetical protein [Clostridiales bacterium]